MAQRRHKCTRSMGVAHSTGGMPMEVKGTFDVQRFYETLAMIISRRENVEITVKVQQEKGDQEEKRKAG